MTSIWLRLLIILIFTGKGFINAQTSLTPYTPEQLFKEIIFRVDTLEFSYPSGKISYSGKDHIPLRFTENDPVVEVYLYPREAVQTDGLTLIPSGDFLIIDSINFENKVRYRFKLRFQQITESDLLSLRFEVRTNFRERPVNIQLPVFGYTHTFVQFYPGNEELFRGEEKVFELVTNNLNNIIAEGVWIEGNGIDHRLIKEEDKLKLYLNGRNTGRHAIDVRIRLKKPMLNEKGMPIHELPPIRDTFQVRTSPLAFLGIDKQEVIVDEESRRGIEVQIDYTPGMPEGKTFRIENREDPGGPLIGELFTRNRIGNGKMLCWLRVFNLHRRSEGYLYIKDVDKAMYVTNFNIRPKTTIQKLTIQRDGQDPTSNLQIFPGETIEIRLEGVSLNRAVIRLEDMPNLQKDTLLKGDNALLYRITVPENIPRKRLNIYNEGVPTGYSLDVKEFQKARPLDFLLLSYDEGGTPRNITFNKVSSAIMYGSSLKDILISPIRNRIDDGRLHGKQYLEIKVTVTGPQRELIEMRTREQYVICPDQSSPRYLYYQGQDCMEGNISINSILSRKTNELDPWSRIEVEIRHRADKHGDESYTHRVEFILSRTYDFDIDVSFPAGLIQLRPGRPIGDQLSSFGGVSLAALAQFSFFRPGQVRQFMPYRVGIGTIAMNAFDFSSDSDNRGLALVALGSLSPTRRDPRLRLTLYFGGGYFLTNSDNVRSPPGWFLLIGPGVAVRL